MKIRFLNAYIAEVITNFKSNDVFDIEKRYFDAGQIIEAQSVSINQNFGTACITLFDNTKIFGVPQLEFDVVEF